MWEKVRASSLQAVLLLFCFFLLHSNQAHSAQYREQITARSGGRGGGWGRVVAQGLRNKVGCGVGVTGGQKEEYKWMDIGVEKQ